MKNTLLSLAVSAVIVAGCTADGAESGIDDGDGYPLEAQKADAPACGAVIGSFGATLAYSNGKYTGTGNSCRGAVEHGLGFQCVELVMRHFKTTWGLRWYGNAKDLLANAPKDKVSVHMNGSGVAPVPGDMIVWTKGTYGHVALVTAVRADAIDILEQNAGTGRATLDWDGKRVGARWGSWEAAGWAHARANGGAPPAPEPTADAGTPDDTSTPDAAEDGAPPKDTGAVEDAAPSVAWSCASSSYGGEQWWTCSGGDRYKCVSGAPVRDDCARGCWAASLGKDDQCISPVGGWSCAASAYGGKQFWTCSGSYMYKCDASGPLVVRCPSGCESHPLGTDDACR